MFNIKGYIFRDSSNLDLRLIIKCPSIEDVSVFLDRVHFDNYDRVIVEPIIEKIVESEE